MAKRMLQAGAFSDKHHHLVIVKCIAPFEQALRYNILVDSPSGVSADGIFQNRQFRFEAVHAAKQTGIVDIEFELLLASIAAGS